MQYNVIILLFTVCNSIKKEEFEGGDGMLLANTFTKAGKPPDNTPAVKSFKKLSLGFDGIEAAGKQGDAKKAMAEWNKTKSLLETFLADVEMLSSLADPIYNWDWIYNISLFIIM